MFLNRDCLTSLAVSTGESWLTSTVSSVGTAACVVLAAAMLSAVRTIQTVWTRCVAKQRKIVANTAVWPVPDSLVIFGVILRH